MLWIALFLYAMGALETAVWADEWAGARRSNASFFVVPLWPAVVVCAITLGLYRHYFARPSL